MPVTLQAECEARLLSILEAELPSALVQHGQFVRSDSLGGLRAGNSALPAKARAQYTDWISDDPFSTFIYGQLSAKVYRDFDFESNAMAKLIDLPGYSDLRPLSQALLDDFKSLPWSYTFLFPLPLAANESSIDNTREYWLTDQASLVAPGSDFAEQFPVLPSEEPPYLMFNREVGPRNWQSNRYYLKLVLQGFIEDMVSTRPVEEASLFLRSLCGLLLSSYAVQPKSSYSLVPTESPFFIYLNHADGNLLLRSHMLPSDYAEQIRNLEWIEIPDVRGAKWPAWMQYLQGLLRLSLTATHEKNAVRRAAQWYFDSECGANDLLQFVQATVAVEILFSDKGTSDVLGVTELLANRCAYLLAESHDERAEMLCEMKELYDTRSAIVHRGKYRLTKDEVRQLAKLRLYCRRLIGKEMKLLAKNQREDD